MTRMNLNVGEGPPGETAPEKEGERGEKNEEPQQWLPVPCPDSSGLSPVAIQLQELSYPCSEQTSIEDRRKAVRFWIGKCGKVVSVR